MYGKLTHENEWRSINKRKNNKFKEREREREKHNKMKKVKETKEK